ncbi:MAG TPA: hypothetical protein IAC82_09005 [Candidatus Merdivicinus intestinigallinarum]|nr:hypothetical protein [Candidatus Merdivicinus intestinigallinarum]
MDFALQNPIAVSSAAGLRTCFFLFVRARGAKKLDFAFCGKRPKALPLESTIFREKLSKAFNLS